MGFGVLLFASIFLQGVGCCLSCGLLFVFGWFCGFDGCAEFGDLQWRFVTLVVVLLFVVCIC